MNSAFISYQKLHLAAQSEGTQTQFPCLWYSPNPLYSPDNLCACANKATGIFNTGSLSYSNRWNKVAPLEWFPAPGCNLSPPETCATPNMPPILEQKRKKKASSFLFLSVFAWVAFLCSATDFFPILEELIWNFCPTLDLPETGGIWFRGEDRQMDRDAIWSQHFQQPH